ncbi:MAG: hypothetical protein AAF429_05135 [Pseudomonadota bacterium]
MKALVLSTVIALGLATSASANVFPYLVFPDANVLVDTDKDMAKPVVIED